MDNLKIARALGIDDALYERWLPFAERVNLKRESEDGVFQLEGFIAASDLDNYMGDEAVGFATPNRLRQFLEGNKGRDIRIDVNSGGGDIFAANAMYSDLLRHDGKVEIVATGAVFSAAVDIFTLKDAERVAMPGSMFMIHNASTFAFGDSNDLRRVFERLEKINDQCADRMSDAWGVHDRADLLRMMDEETWFTETEAVEAGIVARVFEKESGGESDEDEASTDRVIRRGSEAAFARFLAVA